MIAGYGPGVGFAQTRQGVRQSVEEGVLFTLNGSASSVAVDHRGRRILLATALSDEQAEHLRERILSATRA